MSISKCQTFKKQDFAPNQFLTPTVYMLSLANSKQQHVTIRPESVIHLKSDFIHRFLGEFKLRAEKIEKSPI